MSVNTDYNANDTKSTQDPLGGMRSSNSGTGSGGSTGGGPSGGGPTPYHSTM